MSLRIRCPNCRRGMSGKHGLCTDCRAPSTQTTVHVVESGARIEVTTDSPSRYSSSRRGKSRSNYSSADRRGRDERDIEWDIANGYPYYPYERDTWQGHETHRDAYVRPRVHPYSDRYEYVSTEAQSGYPSYGGVYPSSAQRDSVSSSYAGYRQSRSEGHQPRSSYAQTQQPRGQESQVQYVYSGTEGPDGEIID
ncbi:hypothetical protein INS49_003253 [Diaporthe citri]|uniref:uncharacterized protein n=1 Tax=Diaporthe citri TaxID=83186 RepID=UPI001C80F9AE|nr:uncharacterized protein INS49_003253 [Diaporthe citri]KAG6355292.1 hypothetical protein INS49_003253 [Diaporthe citri]